MDFDAVTPAIVLMVYVVVELLKHFVLKGKASKYTMIPVYCIVVGAVIAVLLYIFYPQGVDYSNFLEAIASGGLSGIAATGCNQLWKQYQKYSGNVEEEEDQ